MGHLSTSESVTCKLSCQGAAVESAATGTVTVNNDVNGNAFIVKRLNTSTKTMDLPESSVKKSSDEENQEIRKNGFSKSNGITAAKIDERNDTKKGENKKLYFNPVHHIDLEEYTRNFKGGRIFGIQFEAPLKWDKIIQITLLHIVAVVAFFLYPIERLNLYTVLWAFFIGGVAGFGVTAGAHRYWTHRSYKANMPLRAILMLCFSLSGQNTLYDWVRDHRVHHKYSEGDADPHNANRGFFFAHVGWLMMLKHPEVMRRGRQIDMSDVLEDPVVQFHQKHFVALKTFLCFILPTMIPVYFWGEEWLLALTTQCIFRYVFSLNFTWSVNSAAHMWGTRPYDKRIQPSENIYVSILAMGEGWHNYHHVFPWDYKAAELGKYSGNFTTMVLDLFQKMGWAWDMKQPSKELVKRTMEKYGDGSHETAVSSKSSGQSHGHCHYPEVPDPEYAHDDDAESSSTESSKLDENDNLKEKIAT